MQLIRLKKPIYVLLCMFLALFMIAPLGMTVRAADAPGTPVISQLRNYGDGIEVTWDEATDVSGYYLYRSEDGGSFTKIADISPANNTSYLDEDVEGGGKYAYKMKAYVKSGTKKTAGEYSAKKTTYRVGATQILSVENQTKGIKITWDKVPEATGYKVYRKTGDGEYKLMITKVGADSTSYVNTSAQTGEIYSYWVKPYITPILTNYYNWEDTSVETARLPKVTGVEAKLLSRMPKRVEVNWDWMENVEGFIISQKNITTGKAKNYYVDGGYESIIIPVSSSGEYSYTVRAYVGNYQSAFSAKSQVTVGNSSVGSFQAVVNENMPIYVKESLYRLIDRECSIEDSGIYGIISYKDGQTETVYVSDINPTTVPSEPGEFDVTVIFETPEGKVYTDTVTLNAVYPEPVMSTYDASYAAGLRGSVNGKSLKHIIFTDTVEPSMEDCATKAYIGQGVPTAVVAYRLKGQEDTLYITSGRPGVKVIHSGDGGTINTGFIDDIDCRMLDTSRCTTTGLFWANGGAFQHGVKSINFSGCDFSNVTSLSAAFNTYTSLQYLDLSNCDFSNVETMSHMCYNTPNLIKIDMSGTTWGEGKLKNLEYAFGGSGLQEIDLGDMETSAVTTTQGMFVNDQKLLSVDLSGCDFSNVETAPYMFQDCKSLQTIIFNENGMPNLKGSLRQMFDNCKNLENVDMSNIYLGQNVDNVFRVLFNCQKLRTTLNIDATNFDRSSGYTFADMAIGDNANVIVNCTQASKDILDDYMIWATSVQYQQHVTYNIIDAPTINSLVNEAAVVEQINDVLAQDGIEVDEVLFAADITSNGSSVVEVKGIEAPENAVLYHVGENGINIINYTLANGTLRFESTDFSPFVLATTKAISNDEEPDYTKFLGT